MTFHLTEDGLLGASLLAGCGSSAALSCRRALERRPIEDMTDGGK